MSTGLVCICPHCGAECTVIVRDGMTYVSVKCHACHKAFMARVQDGKPK